MGTCNDNMKTNANKPSDGGDSVFGKLLPKRKKADTGTTVETYAYSIGKADAKLQELVAVKTRDLATEKGSEVANALKLGNLKTQQFHIDAVIDLMNDYQDIK